MKTPEERPSPCSPEPCHRGCLGWVVPSAPGVIVGFVPIWSVVCVAGEVCCGGCGRGVGAGRCCRCGVCGSGGGADRVGGCCAGAVVVGGVGDHRETSYG